MYVRLQPVINQVLVDNVKKSHKINDERNFDKHVVSLRKTAS